MFNITTKNTNVKASIQNDKENNTEVTNRNTQEDRSETQPMNQPCYQFKTVNQQQMEIDRLSDSSRPRDVQENTPVTFVHG